MNQMDLFDETLEKKIHRMEKWIGRLNRELSFLKQVYFLSKKAQKLNDVKKTIEQIDLFGT